jgi:hypothetical protein
VFEPEVLNPVAPVLGSRVLPSVAREIVSDDVFRQTLIKNFRGASRLDRTARKHSNHRSAAIDILGQHFRVLPLILASEQCAEVLNALAVR